MQHSECSNLIYDASILLLYRPQYMVIPRNFSFKRLHNLLKCVRTVRLNPYAREGPLKSYNWWDYLLVVKSGFTTGGKDDVIWIGDDKISVDCSTANVFVRLMFPNKYKMINSMRNSYALLYGFHFNIYNQYSYTI